MKTEVKVMATAAIELHEVAMQLMYDAGKMTGTGTQRPDSVIQAIRQVRDNNPQLGLREAKDIVCFLRDLWFGEDKDTP